MLGSFYASKLKIERACKHFAELEFEIAAYLETNPARFDTRVLDEHGTRRFEFKLHLKQPSLRRDHRRFNPQSSGSAGFGSVRLGSSERWGEDQHRRRPFPDL